MNPRRIHHTAVVVRDMASALARYHDVLGAPASDALRVEEQGVDVAFLQVGDTKLELISPFRQDSSIGRFLDRRGEGLHHIGVMVDDIRAELRALEKSGIELIDRTPRAGAHGLIAFVHPRALGGVLLELVEHTTPSS